MLRRADASSISTISQPIREPDSSAEIPPVKANSARNLNSALNYSFAPTNIVVPKAVRPASPIGILLVPYASTRLNRPIQHPKGDPSPYCLNSISKDAPISWTEEHQAGVWRGESLGC